MARISLTGKSWVEGAVGILCLGIPVGLHSLIPQNNLKTGVCEYLAPKNNFVIAARSFVEVACGMCTGITQALCKHPGIVILSYMQALKLLKGSPVLRVPNGY